MAKNETTEGQDAGEGTPKAKAEKVLVLTTARNYSGPSLKGVVLEKFDTVDAKGVVTRRDGSAVGTLPAGAMDVIRKTGFFQEMPVAEAKVFVARLGKPKPQA